MALICMLVDLDKLPEGHTPADLDDYDELTPDQIEAEMADEAGSDEALACSYRAFKGEQADSVWAQLQRFPKEI